MDVSQHLKLHTVACCGSGSVFIVSQDKISKHTLVMSIAFQLFVGFEKWICIATRSQ